MNQGVGRLIHMGTDSGVDVGAGFDREQGCILLFKRLVLEFGREQNRDRM